MNIMFIVSRIDLIYAKLERADKHIRDLDDSIRLFLSNPIPPYAFRFDVDLNASERTYYVVSAEDVPPDVCAIAGDAIHNLRCALDYLVWQLVEAAGNIPTIHTSFPIFENLPKYKAGETERYGVYRETPRSYSMLRGHTAGETIRFGVCTN